MSHQGQPTRQPARRMKKALRPLCTPSPCREWNVSTTGRVRSCGAAVIAAEAVQEETMSSVPGVMHGRGRGGSLGVPALVCLGSGLSRKRDGVALSHRKD